MTSPNRRFLAAAALASAAVGVGLLAAQEGRRAPAAGPIARVQQITAVKADVQESAPPNLVITVEGVVPTGGWTDVTLLPRVYQTPPADGVYEFDLLAVRPSGPAIQVLTNVKAAHTWRGFPADKVKGVRVYGLGESVKTVKVGGKR